MSRSFASLLLNVCLLYLNLHVSISPQFSDISTSKFSTVSFADNYFQIGSRPILESNFTKIFILTYCPAYIFITNLYHSFTSPIYKMDLCFRSSQLIAKHKYHMGNQVPKKGQEPQAVQTKKSAPEATQQQKAVKIEKTMLVLDRQIKVFQDKQKKSEVLVDQLKAKAKQLVMMGKKNDAKKYLEQATRLKKQAQNYTVRRRVLQNKKFQLETAMMDKNTVNSLESAQQHLKDQQKVNDKLEEIIFQTQQQKMVQDQLNEKLKDMAEDDDMLEDVDDMMAEIEKELNKEKGAKIPQKTVNTNVNVQKQKQSQEDEISKMMAEL